MKIDTNLPQSVSCIVIIINNTIRYLSPYKCLSISLIALIFSALISNAIDIPSLTWTPRPDWIDVTQAPYNADKTGATDSTAAIQAALNKISGANMTFSSTLSSVYFPAGTYKISSTLTLCGASSSMLVGCGKDTKIVWAGARGQAMFWSQGNWYFRFIGLAWDGANLASCAYQHMATANGYYEGRLRHENESFKNFTVPGTYISGATMPAAGIITGINGSAAPDAEDMVWNCLFSNCSNGAIVGYQLYNDYNWIFDGCQFENCGVGVYSPNGDIAVYNCHFASSTIADIEGYNVDRVRRCTSVGSNIFYLGAFNSGATRDIIQDCWIDSWTVATPQITPWCYATSPIIFGDKGPDMVFDCVFTHPPNTNPLIQKLQDSSVQQDLILSNNYCPKSNPMYSFDATHVTTIPSGGRTSSLTSANQTFLKSTWPADSTSILDVTRPPYSADGTATTDATAAIQQAITDAKNANNGSVVYIPRGLYKISSTLTVSGGNYSIEGSGFNTQLLWFGATAAGPMMSMATPQNITISQLMFKGRDETCVALIETSTGTSSATLDGITYYQYPTGNTWTANNAANGPGVVLSNLPAGSLVNLRNLNTPLTVNNCSAATIFGKFVLDGQITVNGATAPKTGFFGIVLSSSGQSTSSTGYDLTVGDNQDMVLGDYYNEQTYNNLNLQRGSGTGTGRVTIQGYRQHTFNPRTQININNYAGRLLYGPQSFENNDDNSPAQITQIGSNAVDLILLGNVFIHSAPTITVSTGCRLIEANNTWWLNSLNYIADILPAGALTSIAAGLDHLRQLGAYDLSLTYGLYQNLVNTSFEPSFASDNVTATNGANPSPLTTLGYQPSSWSQSASLSTSSGLRNVTVVSGGSPFGPGTQSIRLIDKTASTSGERQEFWQRPTSTMPANIGGVFTFDFKLNSSTGGSADHWFTVFAGNTSCCNIGLCSNGTSSVLYSSTIIKSDLLMNTWYRVRVVMGAPSTGPSTATVWLTPWTSTGPGTSTSHTINGMSAASSTGFNFTIINETSSGMSTDFNLDNVSIQNGDFSFPYWF